MTPTQRLVSLLVAAVTAVLLPLGAPAGHAVATAPAQTVQVAATGDYEASVQFWVNRVRKRHDLPRLRPAACTERVAERWSAHLAATGGFYHQSMNDVLDTCDAVYAGETLGRGGMSPRRLVRLWMESPPHRAVLTNPKSRRIGIGARYDDSGRWVVAANFMRF